MRTLFALALLAGTVRADEPKKEAKIEKSPVESKQLRFAATFPGKPKEAPNTVKVNGEDVTITQFMIEIEKTAYLVAVNDYKPGTLAADPQTTLEGIRNGNLGNDGQLLDEDEKRTEFGPDKLPMRTFTFKKDKLFFRNLIVLDGTRLYQVMVVSETEKALTGPEAKQLYESFKVLPREKKK
jgi:hypothetical protein